MELKEPEIKSWDCTDHDPIEEQQPDDSSIAEYWCNVVIGIKGEDGAGNFQVLMVTVKMLSQINDKECLLVILHYEGWNQVLDVLSVSCQKYQKYFTGNMKAISKMRITNHWCGAGANNVPAPQFKRYLAFVL